MEPLGTITKSFHLFSEESVEVLKRIMNNAESYIDFKNRLTRYVKADVHSPELASIASIHIYHLKDIHLGMTLLEKYSDVPFIRLTMNYGLAVMGNEAAWEKAIADANLIVEDSTSPNWVKLLALSYKGDMVQRQNPREGNRVFEDAIQLIENTPELKCFIADIYMVYAGGFFMLSDWEKYRELNERAKEVAVAYGDDFILADILNGIALSTAIDNPRKAIEIYEEAGQLYRGFDYSSGMMTNYNNIGYTYMILGEYDLAIDCYEKAIEHLKKTPFPIYNAELNISVLYSSLGEYDKALEHAENSWKLATKSNQPLPAPHIEYARALILEGRLSEAVDHLEKGGELAFEVQSTKELSRYHLIRGLYEKERENYSEAFSSMSRALRIAEKCQDQSLILRSLLNLSEVEAVLSLKKQKQISISNSSMSLSRIEQIASEQNLPGLLVQTKLLKSQIHRMRGKQKLAQEILMESIDIAKTNELESLEKLVHAQLENLEDDEPEESLLNRFKTMIRNIAIPALRSRPVEYNVMGVLMIVKDAGIEIYSNYIDEKLTSDPSLAAGLITAVSSFTQELKQDATGFLQSIVHQDIAVLLEHGEYTTCALLTDKDTAQARTLERVFLNEFEEQFKENLELAQDGMVRPIDANSLFQRIVVEKKSELKS